MGSQVFLDLKWAVDRYKIPATGIVHVGAHTGEEVPTYLEIGFKDINLVEPNPLLGVHLFKLKATIDAQFPNTKVWVYLTAVGLREEYAPLYMCPSTQRWSLIETSETFGTTDVPVTQLQHLPILGSNVLVIDVQGSELDVLKSDDPNYKWDMIICEIDRSGRYPGVDPDAVVAAIESRGMRVAATFEHDQNPEIKDVMFVKQ